MQIVKVAKRVVLYVSIFVLFSLFTFGLGVVATEFHLHGCKAMIEHLFKGEHPEDFHEHHAAR